MKKPSALVCLSLMLILMMSVDSHACAVCHSKNPKMARMHEALEFKDCFICHGPTAIISTEEPKKQRKTDKRCIRCHAL